MRMFSNSSRERKWNLRHDAAMRLALALLGVALAGQIAFWNDTRTIIPEMSIVADVPGERTVRALSFGDEEAFFRLLGLGLQNSGDTFGRFTPLYKYDYGKLYHWFRLLDGLNHESNFLAGMARPKTPPMCIILSIIWRNSPPVGQRRNGGGWCRHRISPIIN